MNLEQKIGQRLMIGIRGPSLDRETRAHLGAIAPGGVILFSRNISRGEQVRELVRQIKETVQPSPLIAIDQEGGLVVRFFRDITIMPGNMALGAIGLPELAYKQGVCMARELRSIGIDINLAPVVDVVTNPDNPGITIRSFGSDPQKVTALGVSCIQGMQACGIGAVAKHFPGKGAASKDAHFDLPTVAISRDEMMSTHLYPFSECIKNDVQGVMSTHVIYPNLPGAQKVPATFAPELIKDYLRGAMNFKGVIFSDDLEMGAITKFFAFDEAVVNAVRAGHDMVLICSDYKKQRIALKALLKVYEADKKLLEEMDESLERIAKLRNFNQLTNHTADLVTQRKAKRLAVKIAEGSITVMQGQAPIPFPLDKIRHLFAIVPDLSQLESVEEGFEPGENNAIERALRARFPITLRTEFIALDPSIAEIDVVRHGARKADLVLAFIFNARFQRGQRLLLERLKAYPQKVIFILIRNPFDVELLGQDLTSVITYGYRKIQIEAAIRVLGGDIPAIGKLPFNTYFPRMKNPPSFSKGGVTPLEEKDERNFT